MNNFKAYAKALKELSVENNIDINQIVSELQLVNSYLDDEFISFLKNPKISKDNKKSVFQNVFKNLNKYVFSTLLVMVDNNTIVYLNDIIMEIQNLLDEEKGVITLEVLTVKPLSELEKLEIIKYFTMKLMKTINLKEIIKNDLVGGLVIKYKGKIIDGSLITKQESLKEYLKK